ncbi:hypothetical protein PviCFBP13515_15240 [Pseudomonas viridiflava]|nr:hypothetical protein PviCFBP13507_00610 [Pseudomonas viridiflava]TKK26079.1 hypothetical protein PviCFBP13515_15240 [Pseudomonas viridiflava]
MMRLNAQVEKVYLYPKTVDFRKSIDGMAALVEPDIRIDVFNPVLFVFLNKRQQRYSPNKNESFNIFLQS